jgi:hypothetical protein
VIIKDMRIEDVNNTLGYTNNINHVFVLNFAVFLTGTPLVSQAYADPLFCKNQTGPVLKDGKNGK